MRRGWCPTVHAPMPTGDGLLARVKPPASRLDPAQLIALAEAAGRFGNGTIELTSRAHIQIRGIRDTAAFAAAMVAAGLADPDPARERARAVMTGPGADGGLALSLEAALVTVSGLPEKFGAAVEDRRFPLGPIAEDLVLAVEGDEARLHVGGAEAGVALADAIEAAVQVARSLAEEGRRGWEGDASARLIAAGLGARPATRPARAAFALAGLPFGTGPAALWAALAAWGPVQLTPFRAVVAPGAPLDALGRLGLLVEPDDPRWRVVACSGAPACASATVPTRSLAMQLVCAGTVHVSGCDKGCARRAPADWTVVGRSGAYDLVRGGHVGDAPIRTGLTAGQVIEALA